MALRMDMNIYALYRNPIYRAYPEVFLRRLVRTFYHPPHGSQFETTLLWGDHLTSIYDDEMGPSQWRYGLYDLPLCEVIARILQPGDGALDIGANVGQMTLLMSRAVGLAGWVDSIEPHPAIFRMLQSNVSESAFKSRITIRQCAISDQNGTSSLKVPTAYSDNIGICSLEHRDNSGNCINVRTHTLDTLYASRDSIDLVKIDVEEHEYAVFRGAHLLLRRKAIRCIIFEELDFQHSAIPSLLIGYGYRLFAINTPAKVVEEPICNAADNPKACNYLALRDLDDAERIRTPKTLTIRHLAGNFAHQASEAIGAQGGDQPHR